MRARRLSGLLLALCLSVPWLGLRAQSTEDELRTRLLSQPLFLRGGWIDDKLKFDADGQPEKPYKTGPPTVCGFRADKVELKDDRLRVTGVRMGITFPNHVETRVVLPESGKQNAPDEKITIEIDGHGRADFANALKEIFTDRRADVQRASANPPGKMPAACTNTPAGAGAAGGAGGGNPCGMPSHVGGAIRAPRLLASPEPDFSDWARRLKYSGNVEVYLVVDTEGVPARIRVVRPAGLGLDEKAVAAVEKYRFAPAMRDGQPVPVDLYVEVNFQIF